MEGIRNGVSSMSCVFIRPVLPHGYLPSTDWDYPLATNYDSCNTWTTSDVVDADQLQQNWAIIFSKFNGLIDGTDFLATSGKFDEETALVDYENGAGGNWPTAGQRHSHDGIDSAKLADDVIHQITLGAGEFSWGSFGIIRVPTEGHRCILMTSTVAFDQPAPDGDTVYSKDIAIPYDWKKWGKSTLYRSTTNGRVAVLIAPMFIGHDGWTRNQKCAPSMVSADFTLDVGEVDAVTAKMQSLMGEQAATNWTYAVLTLACLDLT